MSPPTKNTYWLGVITSTKSFFVSTSSHFASSCLELSFLSPRVAFGNFSDYSSLMFICISFSFLRILLSLCFFFNSVSFFFLDISFFLDIRSISVADLLLTATTVFLSFFYFFSIFLIVCKTVTWVLIQGQKLTLEHRWKRWRFQENKQKKKTRKSLLPRPNPQKWKECLRKTWKEKKKKRIAEKAKTEENTRKRNWNKNQHQKGIIGEIPQSNTWWKERKFKTWGNKMGRSRYQKKT